MGDPGDTGRAGKGQRHRPDDGECGRGAAADDICPTCGGVLGPGKIGRFLARIDNESTWLRTEMGEE